MTSICSWGPHEHCVALASLSILKRHPASLLPARPRQRPTLLALGPVAKGRDHGFRGGRGLRGRELTYMVSSINGLEHALLGEVLLDVLPLADRSIFGAVEADTSLRHRRALCRDVPTAGGRQTATIDAGHRDGSASSARTKEVNSGLASTPRELTIFRSQASCSS